MQACLSKSKAKKKSELPTAASENAIRGSKIEARKVVAVQVILLLLLLLLVDDSLPLTVDIWQ